MFPVRTVDHDSGRVTKGKGKKLRIEVRCTAAFDFSELSIWLLDDDGSVVLEGFTVDHAKNKLEVEPDSVPNASIPCSPLARAPVTDRTHRSLRGHGGSQSLQDQQATTLWGSDKFQAWVELPNCYSAFCCT